MSLYRVRTAWTGGPGGPGVTTCYFNALTPRTAQNAVTAMASFWFAGIGAMISNVYSFRVEDEVGVVDATTGLLIDIVTVTGDGGNGASSAEQLPPATQGLVKLGTGIFIGGRQLIGHLFIPGLTETANDGGKLNGSNVTTINSAATTLIGDANSDLFVYSRKNHTAYNVTSMKARTKFAVLRSRRD